MKTISTFVLNQREIEKIIKNSLSKDYKNPIVKKFFVKLTNSPSGPLPYYVYDCYCRIADINGSETTAEFDLDLKQINNFIIDYLLDHHPAGNSLISKSMYFQLAYVKTDDYEGLKGIYLKGNDFNKELINDEEYQPLINLLIPEVISENEI